MPARIAPSRRSLVVGFAVAAIALAAYAVARETSLFAIDAIDLRGVKGPAAADVRRALAEWRGKSLVGLDGAELLSRVESVPWVAGARLDRAFPHTLRVDIRAEHPVAVLRRARDSWLVSARGRVLAPVRIRTHRDLPRIWLPSATPVALGELLPAADGGTAARALAPLRVQPFPTPVRTAALSRGQLVLVLGDGVQLRLGRPVDLGLKIAIARRIVDRLAAGTAFLDVSVPERPVAGTPQPPSSSTQNPQVSG
jgi:cell division protein FtsQ